MVSNSDKPLEPAPCRQKLKPPDIKSPRPLRHAPRSADPLTDLMSGNASGKPFGPAALQTHLDWFDKCLLSLVICLPLGTPIGLLQASPGAAQSPARRTDLGLVLHPAHQRKGYGAEALKYGVAWCFDSLGLNKVELGTFGFNGRAQRCYEGVGFVREGVRRAEHWVRGEWVDGWEYGMLRGEWEGVRGRWEEEERRVSRVVAKE